MDIQQNTEFILSKVDSLMQGAMPYLEKGGEEIIKYKVVEFRATAILCLLFPLMLLIGIVFLTKGIKVFDKESPKDAIYIILGAVLTLIGLTTTLLELGPRIPKFVLSFTSPEMFAIMELIGK